jgi:hypothetical protein
MHRFRIAMPQRERFVAGEGWKPLQSLSRRWRPGGHMPTSLNITIVDHCPALTATNGSGRELGALAVTLRLSALNPGNCDA